MIHHREQDEVRRFDIFKLIILLILLALLLWFWLSPPAFVQGPDDGGDTAVATDTDTGSDEADSGGDEAPQVEAPSLDSPASDADLEVGSHTFSGTGTPGSTVRVLVDGVEVGETEVDASGNWSYDLDLEAGSRDITFEALDADGNVAGATGLTFDIAETMAALDIPTLNLPDGNLLGGALNFGGTGTPGSEVGVVVDGELLGTTTVDADGNWSFDAELGAGDHDVRLQAIDLDGNIAGESDGFDLSLGELTLPDFDLPSFDFSAGGIDFSGVGTPGSTVEVVANGEVVGTAEIGPDGTWSIPADLAAGAYDLHLRMFGPDGNLLGESEGRNVTVAAADDGSAEFVLPTFNLPDLDLAGGDVTLTGTGTPGSEVEIVLNGEVVGTAVVGDDGTWSFPTNIPGGDYDLTLRTVDGSGTAVETDPFSFSLAPFADVASATLDSPADGSSVESGELSFSGTGEPGTEVEILDGDEVIGTAVVGDDGTWTFSYTPDAGDHAYAVRNAGAADASATSNVTVAEAAAADSGDSGSDGDSAAAVNICQEPMEGIDQGDTYIVGVCEWLTRIAKRLGIEYFDLIGVNPQIEDPNLIHPGQVINLPPR